MEDCEETSARSSEYGDADTLEGCAEGLEEDEPVMPDSGSLDQGSSTAVLLPSMFKGREPTVWFEYPVNMGMQRQERRDDVVDFADKR
jgi:hypothetical protein